MHILISLDDTDNLDSRGTGKLAQILAERIETLGLGTCSAVSRHQLFVHEQIPYTSHNSAMCFEARIGEQHLQRIIDMGRAFLEAECAAGSDPGLCVASVTDARHTDRLIEFGRLAKQAVLSKADAYHLAQEIGIHLSEHGGTGGGVIGALAGIGLRLSGHDGRFRGWLSFGKAGDLILAGACRAHPAIDDVRNEHGGALDDATPIVLGDDRVKIVHQDWKRILLVRECAEPGQPAEWVTLTSQQAKML